MNTNTPVFTPFDHDMMSEALRLARNGLYSTRPNPAVGCVIVKSGIIVGRGWHQRAGEAHAEINALKQARQHAQGATVYVTLEPCSHTGKTPPCSNALIEAGVARVIVAVTDPNPLVSGNGIKALQSAGIEVQTGLLQIEASEINAGFIQRMTSGRPFVRAKVAMSLDGRTALASGESQWITELPARRDGHLLRARSGAILTGSGTVLKDNPRMTVRCDEFHEAALPQPWRIVVDSSLRTPTDAQILSTEGAKMLISTLPDPVFKKRYSEHTELYHHTLPNTEGKVDLTELMYLLAQNYQINDLLVEAGATLTGAMLTAGLVDELHLYLSPDLLGDSGAGMASLPCIHTLKERLATDIISIKPIGRDWRIIARPSKRAHSHD
jgi:diaminohydroxyphosphoribosylaminopyrimidine deaminase/5-amino-6-(5-phosphoribosylamino)uracil reductase